MKDESFPVATVRHSAADMPPGARALAGHSWTAAEQERRRWARELHDETLQNLAGMLLRLSSARRRGGEAVVQAVEETIAALQDEIANLRSLITDLRPAALDELGIEAAITALAQRAVHNGLDVSLSLQLADRCRQRFELDTAVYRVVQEALTNAHKHGRATRARVDVHEADGQIEASVRDDGAGFDPRRQTSGFGLLGMRERVELFGGTLTVDSRPGHGATVIATLPAGETALAAAQHRAA